MYILRSTALPKHRYIGITKDLRMRLREHNLGRVPHTSKFVPWTIQTYVGFCERRKAVDFERYLKTGAGWAFSLKRL